MTELTCPVTGLRCRERMPEHERTCLIQGTQHIVCSLGCAEIYAELNNRIVTGESNHSIGIDATLELQPSRIQRMFTIAPRSEKPWQPQPEDPAWQLRFDTLESAYKLKKKKEKEGRGQ